MNEGFLVKDCVINADSPDGKRGEKISVESVGKDTFKKLVFNGAVVPVKPKPEKAEAAKSK